MAEGFESFHACWSTGNNKGNGLCSGRVTAAPRGQC